MTAEEWPRVERWLASMEHANGVLAIRPPGPTEDSPEPGASAPAQLDPAQPAPIQPAARADATDPEIVWQSDEISEYEEGCLSIPDVFAEVERPSTVRVQYTDRKDAEHEMDCDGLLSTVVQHEIDHLDGKLFIDFLSRLKRDMVVKKFMKARRSNAAVG